MRVTISPDERAVVEATLAYANKQPTFLGGLALLPRGVDVAGVTRTKGAVSLGFHALPPNLHGRIREWLSRIAREGRPAVGSLTPEINAGLKAITTHPEIRHGTLVLTQRFPYVDAVFVYGVALILDRARGLTERLGRCNYCGRFRLDFEGRPRMYCSEAHRLAYDGKMAAERMRAWRQRRRKKRGGKGR